MVTFVGTQAELADALRDLLELDYEAKEAYEAAINRIENQDYKIQLKTFKEDHERHIDQISQLLQGRNESLPVLPSLKQWLTKGKVLFANMVGDKTILKAMNSNEEDTNTAYERMNEREDLGEAKSIIAQGLQDERKHKSWLEKESTY